MKQLLVIALLVFLSQTLFAEESLGRLFSTPSERAALDQVRKIKREIVPQVVEETAPVETVPYIAPNSVTVQGYVKRSDGKSATVWVNDEAIQENSGNQDVTVGSLSNQTNRVPIKLKANGKHLSLKAGQMYDPETNRVREMREAVHGDSGRIGDEDSP